jgi:squalene-hopene/tetraprenyl-beta-curcumene cyclase
VRYDKAVHFLHQNQQEDGSWLALWFGNQDHADQSNPVYGSSRVLVAGALGVISQEAVDRGCEHLIESQNDDGGWGGGPSLAKWLKSHAPAASQLSSSVEETALAVDALSTVLLSRRNLGDDCGVQSGWIAQESGQDGSKSSSTRVAGGNQAYCEAIIRGVEFLLRSVDDGRHRVPWPIGFYFAKLWYHEKLYPLIFATTALGKYLRATAEDFDPNWPR